MKILIIGEGSSLQETKLKFGEDHQYVLVREHREAQKFIEGMEVVFDFVIEDEPNAFEIYHPRNLNVFLNTTKISLNELNSMVRGDVKSAIFGFNGLPTFLNRQVMEVSILRKEHETDLAKLCGQLKTEFQIVDDRVGLVTPRVICMIINEAYFTEQEGTATRADIDLAMKLGTNYPFGPFEWCQRIGVRNVYETLEAVYEDTRDERYKVCPALKKEYLRVK
jgi:3-hydroxybutyryl-CoA dehydrogenase